MYSTMTVSGLHGNGNETYVRMRGSSNCKVFEVASKALKWIAEHALGCSNMVHILDIIFFAGETYEK